MDRESSSLLGDLNRLADRLNTSRATALRVSDTLSSTDAAKEIAEKSSTPYDVEGWLTVIFGELAQLEEHLHRAELFLVGSGASVPQTASAVDR